MNYKYLVMEEFAIFCEAFPDYSVSEVIFAILNSYDSSKKLSWIYEIQDKDLLTAIENAKIKETESKEIEIENED